MDAEDPVLGLPAASFLEACFLRWVLRPAATHGIAAHVDPQAEVDTLVAWADNGAPEGDKKDAPPPLTFHDGWNIQPDMIKDSQITYLEGYLFDPPGAQAFVASPRFEVVP